MAITTIVKFNLVDTSLENDWNELSSKIQMGISQSDGFISRDTGKDVDGNFYCIVKFESAEQSQKNMENAEKNYPEMFEAFGKIVDMASMKKTVVELN